MEAVGKPVNLRYKPAADKPEILGTSQRVEYNVGSAKVVMSGDARLVQGQDVFTGDQVEYDLKGDVVRARGAGANGRIQFTIQPRGQSVLPATKKPLDMAQLIAWEVVKRYRKRVVVDAASLTVASGEVVGLLGPNGAGKTTTFT